MDTIETVALKTFANGEWWLVPGAEFTRAELEPFKAQMKACNTAILEANENVKVPFLSYTRERVFRALGRAEVKTDEPDPIAAYCEKIINGPAGLKAFEYHEMATPTVDRDVAVAAWVIRCLGNGGEEAQQVVDAIVERRAGNSGPG